MKNGVLTFSPLLLNLDTIVKLLSGGKKEVAICETDS